MNVQNETLKREIMEYKLALESKDAEITRLKEGVS
jgi:hypothetical protein